MLLLFRSPEVLRLISNILMFDTDERVVVGLEVPQGSLLSNIFNTITSPLKAVQTQAPPTDIEVSFPTSFLLYFSRTWYLGR